MPIAHHAHSSEANYYRRQNPFHTRSGALVECSDCGAWEEIHLSWIVVEDPGFFWNYHYPDLAPEHSYRWVCSNCRGEYQSCTCGRDVENLTLTEDGDLCDSCLEEYVNCSYCGRWVNENHVGYEEDDRERPICGECRRVAFFTCSDCEQLVNRDYLVHDDYIRICECCYDDHWFFCEQCNSLVHTDSQEHDEDEDRYLCHECYENRGRNYIRHYDSWPDMVFHGSEPYYGVELETDGYNSRYEAGKNLFHLSDGERVFYMKNDGSLDNGIELCFMPRSMDEWRRYIEDGLMLAVVREIIARGGSSFNSSTCGIHIHRSKTDMTDFDITKLITAVIRFRPQIIKVAQRESRRYASFDELSAVCEHEAKLVYKKFKGGELAYNKYIALNMQHRNTIEFRVFKGTLKIETFLSYIQFYDQLVKWVKSESLIKMIQDSDSALWGRFLAVLDRKNNAELVARLERLQLI